MQAQDWKSFKSGGYKLFKEGHVQKIFVTRLDENYSDISCQCLPEMKKDCVYQIKLSFSKSNATHAERTCPAGSCKHIAAAMFTLEDFSTLYGHIKESAETVSCTEKLHLEPST